MTNIVQTAGTVAVGSGAVLGDTAFIGYIVCMISGMIGASIAGMFYEPIERWRASLNARLCNCAAWFRSLSEFCLKVLAKCPTMARSAAIRAASALASLSERSRSKRSMNANCRSSISFWKRFWSRSSHHCKNAPTANDNIAAKESSATFDQSTQCMNDSKKCINVVSPNEQKLSHSHGSRTHAWNDDVLISYRVNH